MMRSDMPQGSPFTEPAPRLARIRALADSMAADRALAGADGQGTTGDARPQAASAIVPELRLPVDLEKPRTPLLDDFDEQAPPAQTSKSLSSGLVERGRGRRHYWTSG